MRGFSFTNYVPPEDDRSLFEKLLEIFQELLVYTSGDVDEAEDWMRQLDKQYQLTNPEYTLDDFFEDLRKKNFIQEGDGGQPRKLSSKMEQLIRSRAMEQVFGRLKKGGTGEHRTNQIGPGGDPLPELRPYEFGDALSQVNMTESLRGVALDQFGGVGNLTENDLKVNQRSYYTQTSTVLMIDISHSMILYGEDRITPSKKVAMALAEFVKKKYPKDTLDIIVFGNDAWEVKLKDLPYLQVGPYHTNTVAGLQLAQTILRRKKNPNKQIFMITDGKPSCLKEGSGYYQNSFGLDPKIVNRTLNEAAACKRAGIAITTFMIATDPYLKTFIEQFTEAANGKAFYSGLDNLGSFIFTDFESNRRKKI
jgi:uncharacterized protein with von Willebrand factor type A (vWA) domain